MNDHSSPPRSRIIAPRHALARMLGRSGTEPHRAATPLELFYDLTIVVAFSLASEEFAHALAEDHVLEGVVAFGFAMFAVIWAWMSHTRFATAYDTDDWFVRVAVLVQMVGVVVLALGIPPMFEAMSHWDIDNGLMVLGYVIMRVPLIALWARAATQDAQHRSTAARIAIGIAAAQVGWVALLLVDPPTPIWFALAGVLFVFELGHPIVAQRLRGALPWHPHHLAERYGLLAIIAFGEVVLGTTFAVGAVIDEQGLSTEALGLAFAGVALTFGMWWTYFSFPTAELLAAFPRRTTTWAYLHLVTYASIAAVGAGLHVVAYAIEDHVELAPVAVLATVAVPLAVVLAMAFVLYRVLLGPEGFDPLHLLLRSISAIVIVGALVMAWAGVPPVLCLLVLMLTPWVSIVTYEVFGHRHVQESLDRAVAGD
ncbi:membrane protein [Agromyces rhizosphaerae]|uniref:Membrane protein n=1 Tax=Agromyces rhizosphaerae TaxID=88374 RepID=A0A9W6CX53_9MICO|nr:low temperature requirement protein A [Agromyces rhizosphaerae]GLI26934.1 membrane protein [Agromyces rhizosphaerae]